jgi:RNA polymerase sigma factor (sigma-70 family)
MTGQSNSIIETVKSYGKRLFGFIRKQVGSDADAEDILQDVWYQFSNLADVETLENTGAWLYRVARNKVTDRYRRRRPDSLEDYGFEDDEGEFHFGELLLADDNTPETEHLRQVFWEELFAALEDLPKNQRDVFIWNEMEGQTLQHIADRTGENIKTLISRKRYAVQQLRRRLEALHNDLIDF